MKRRKRTSKNVPAKGRLRDMADRLWSLAVKADWGDKCAVCGNRHPEAHHLIPRQHQATRYDLRNGIGLCSRCHQFDPATSPHQNAAGWMDWLKFHHPETWAWYTRTEQDRKAFDGTTNAEYYCDHIRRLREYVESDDFERVVGVRFAAYLEETNR